MLDVAVIKKLDHTRLDYNLTFSNEITAVLGPSGAGKTTLLNMIAGIVKPDSGSIKFENELYFDEQQKFHRKIQHRQVGYVFQDYALFPHLTVEQNINYQALNATSGQVMKTLMDSLGISHLLPAYPARLSGGEKQRVSLARALAVKPRLLLLDEPFSSLDDDTRARCQHELKLVQEMWSIPVIIVTHSKQEAKKLAQRIVTIENGSIKKDERVKHSEGIHLL